MKKASVLVMVVLASLFLLAGGAWAAEFCVYPGGEGEHDLQTALTTAQSNDEDDLIQVVQGSYYGNFVYASSEGYNITLEGGYTTGCASRVLDPANTILDAAGSGMVLMLTDNSTTTNGGDIKIDGFTMQNGNCGGSIGFGQGVYVSSGATSGISGYITITNNIITGNTGELSGGGIYAHSVSSSGTAGNIILTNNTITNNTVIGESGHIGSGGGVDASSYADTGTSGAIILANNIITGNTADFHGGGIIAWTFSNAGTDGVVTLTNNTITGNIADTRGGGASLLMGGMGGGIVNAYNNIVWNNISPDGGDIFLGDTGIANGYNNDYGTMSGSWTNSGNNINANPFFVDPGYWDDNGTPSDPSDDFWVDGDYHLRPSSPCIDAGTAGAPGLPATDFEGDPRTIGSAPDIGADEYVPVYVILHRDGAVWSSETGWVSDTPPYYPGSDWARDVEIRMNGDFIIVGETGWMFDPVNGMYHPWWYPPYYYGEPPRCIRDMELQDDGDEGYGFIQLHKDGALVSSDAGWLLTTPPYYADSDYARALEIRTDGSYVILHKEGAIYDSASGWITTMPPYYPGVVWAVDMKLEAGGYVMLHKDGALWSTSGGWVVTIPPYYPGTDYARALEIVGSRYLILHRDGAIYDSFDGWNMEDPPYYPDTDYAVDLEVQ